TAGADITLTDQTGATALMWGSHRGYVNVVKLLLARDNVNLDEKNHSGYTALSLAEYNNYPDVIELLKKAGAS
ncbi:ankyrin repeat domain-containing protein, partial [Crocosphaera watsonii]